MKRTSSSSKNTTDNLVYQTWLDSATGNVDSNFMAMVRHKIDRAITTSGRALVSVSFFYPQNKLAPILRTHKPTKVRVVHEWCGVQAQTVDNLEITWNFTSNLPILTDLFSDSLKERYYPSQSGNVNFAEKEGGKINVDISDERPIKIVYKCVVQEATISFYLERLKGFVGEDGVEYFEPLI